MRMVGIISALSAIVGYGLVHFAFFAKPKPAPVPAAPAVEAAAEPVCLAQVVDVLDTESLLNPQPRADSGEPFDPVVPAAFLAPAATEVAPIPRAKDDDDAVPAPRARVIPVKAEEPVADAPAGVIIGWYGPHRLPKQIGGGRPADEVAIELREFLIRSQNGYRPSGVSCGLGLYF